MKGVRIKSKGKRRKRGIKELFVHRLPWLLLMYFCSAVGRKKKKQDFVVKLILLLSTML